MLPWKVLKSSELHEITKYLKNQPCDVIKMGDYTSLFLFFFFFPTSPLISLIFMASHGWFLIHFVKLHNNENCLYNNLLFWSKLLKILKLLVVKLVCFFIGITVGGTSESMRRKNVRSVKRAGTVRRQANGAPSLGTGSLSK